MYLAVDIGGTKTLVVGFSKKGEKINSVKFDTPALYEDFLAEVADTVDKLSTTKYVGGVVAVPGKVDRKTGVGIAFGNLAWQHVPIRGDISKIAGCPITIENDANLAGVSEARLLKDYKRVMYITISTGIGGVMVVDGKVDKGTQNAEIGQILLEHDGKLQRWEDFASGRAIVEKFGKRVKDIEQSDSQAWYTIARNIAIGLIDVIAMLTPDAIVIGGGVGVHLPNFEDKLLEELRIYENPLLSVPPIIRAKRAEEAVVYGCFELAKEHYGNAA